ncbi:hypothetical protein HS9_03257 [Bacillus velezensis]|nr:hypothetical protein HS9_03257 [Bacillus velezensis]
MHPPHILIGENQRVTGLLDWTEAKVVPIRPRILSFIK